MNKLVLGSADGIPAVIDYKTEEVIFYPNDISAEVIENSLNIFNRMRNIREVDEYLLNEENCTSDDREFIIESLTNYINMNTETVNQTAETVETSGPTTPTVTSKPATNEVNLDCFKAIAQNPNAAMAAPEVKQKRQWTRRVTDGPAMKISSTSDFIKVMEEKIEMVKILDQVTMPELPGGMTKANRDIMVEFQKEQSALISKFMEKIQKA